MPEISYKNVPVHYEVQGKGRAVVLLHGFLENLSMWKELSEELSKKYKMVSIDLFGHGGTGNLGYIHTMEEQAKMVKAVLDVLNLRRYVLIGHSMGGYIALAMAEAYPENIKGLCLLNSTALEDSDEKKLNRDRAVEAVKSHTETFVKMAIPNLFSEDNRTKFLPEIQAITKEALRSSKQGIIAAIEGMKIRKNRVHLLKSEQYPIFMIMSKKDPALVFDSLVEQTKNTPVLTAILPDGHMSHIENKEEVTEILVQFVKKCY